MAVVHLLSILPPIKPTNQMAGRLFEFSWLVWYDLADWSIFLIHVFLGYSHGHASKQGCGYSRDLVVLLRLSLANTWAIATRELGHCGLLFRVNHWQISDMKDLFSPKNQESYMLVCHSCDWWFNSFIAISNVWTGLRSDTTVLVLVWIQTVWHSDGIPERIFRKNRFWKKISRRQQKHEKLPSMQTVWHSDGVPESKFLNKLIMKKVSKWQQKHKKLTSMQRVRC